LTALLVFELCAIFLAAPLAANGLPLARALADSLVLPVLVIVVMLSHRSAAIVLILLGRPSGPASYCAGNGHRFRPSHSAAAVTLSLSPP